jgi:hypothetical protein
MFPDYHHLSPLTDRAPKPDRRPLPLESEIRMRIKRVTTRKEA